MRIWPPRAGRAYRSCVINNGQIHFHEPRVIAVTSGKGGVGKTSLSVNLAICLAQAGRRIAILDADLGMANVELLMGLVPPYSLYEVLYGDKTIEEIAVRGPLDINVISGGSGFLEMANLDRARRRRLLEMLNDFSSRYDFVIIDTGAGINKNVLGFVAAAGEVIVVITPEPTSLTDAYALIKVLDNFKVHSEVSVVVNQAADRREAMRAIGKVQAAVNRFLKIKLNVLGWIPVDRLISQSIKNQQPFLLTNPDSPASRSVAGIAEALLGEAGTVSHSGFWEKLVGLFG